MRLHYLQATAYSIGVRIRDTDWGYDPRIPYLSIWQNLSTGWVSLKYADHLPLVNFFGVAK